MSIERSVETTTAIQLLNLRKVAGDNKYSTDASEARRTRSGKWLLRKSDKGRLRIKLKKDHIRLLENPSHDRCASATKKFRDPPIPKRARSKYMLYFENTYDTVRKSLPMTAQYADVIKKMAKNWKALDNKEKLCYKKLAEEDKARYIKELKEYNSEINSTMLGVRLKLDAEKPPPHFKQVGRWLLRKSDQGSLRIRLIHTTYLKRHISKLMQNMPANAIDSIRSATKAALASTSCTRTSTRAPRGASVMMWAAAGAPTSSWQTLVEAPRATSKKNDTIRSSRFTGVYGTSRGKWHASISVQSHVIPLGDFDIEEDAARAYDAARVTWRTLIRKSRKPLNFPNEAPLASALASLPMLPKVLQKCNGFVKRSDEEIRLRGEVARLKQTKRGEVVRLKQENTQLREEVARLKQENERINREVTQLNQ
tara:strand:+ start:1105 stop:2379 length:1275 start_codon:yes stop_codon:yes gene_type:complete